MSLVMWESEPLTLTFLQLALELKEQLEWRFVSVNKE